MGSGDFFWRRGFLWGRGIFFFWGVFGASLDFKVSTPKGRLPKNKNGKFGPFAETRGGGRTGLKGPIELIGDEKCQNNESFS